GVHLRRDHGAVPRRVPGGLQLADRRLVREPHRSAAARFASRLSPHAPATPTIAPALTSPVVVSTGAPKASSPAGPTAPVANRLRPAVTHTMPPAVRTTVRQSRTSTHCLRPAVATPAARGRTRRTAHPRPGEPGGIAASTGTAGTSAA